MPARQYRGLSLTQASRRDLRGFRIVVAICMLATLFIAVAPARASRPANTGNSGALSTAIPGAGMQGAVPTSPLILSSERGMFVPEPADQPTLIRLGAGYELDPSVPDSDQPVPADLRTTAPTGGERGAFIVQFHGPIGQAERSFIESLGGRIYGYVPDYAFLVSLTGDASDRVAASSRVAWTGLYQPAYKISTEPQMKENGRKEMILLLFPDASIDEASAQARAAGATVLQTYDNGINGSSAPRSTWRPSRPSPGFPASRGSSRARSRSSTTIGPSGSSRPGPATTGTSGTWGSRGRGRSSPTATAASGRRTSSSTTPPFRSPPSGTIPTHRKVIAYMQSVGRQHRHLRRRQRQRLPRHPHQLHHGG